MDEKDSGSGADARIGDPGPYGIDRIDCGTGEDFLEAGQGEVVNPDCERVNRF